MSRRFVLCAVCLVIGWSALDSVNLRAEEPKELHVIFKDSTPELFVVRPKMTDSGVVIRSVQDLVAHSTKPDSANDPVVQKALESELVKSLRVDRIDWSKQMVLVVRGRSTSFEIGTVKIEAPKIDGKNLLVTWKNEYRTARSTYQGPPTGFALVERFEGEVIFTKSNSLSMNLMLIPSGKFLMGSPKGEPDRLDEEAPHEVEITHPFYMSQHEVSVAQFRSFARDTNYKTEAEKDGKGGRAFDGKEFVYKPEFTWKNLFYRQTDDDPVIVVSWNDAVAFCEWLSKKEEKTYRLPTEAEWEYACRARTSGRFNTGDKEDDLKSAGNIADASLRQKWADAFWAMRWDDGYPFTAPVGKFKANAFGLRDMHGNAWEWCSDWYAEDYYAKSPKQDPPGPTIGKERVARGGAWSTQPKFCRSAYRDWHEPSYRSDCVGFRVVMTEVK